MVAKDVHGDIWKFKYLFITDLSIFVHLKVFLAGDSGVLMRADTSDLFVEIICANRVGISEPNSALDWHSFFSQETGHKLIQKGKSINSSGKRTVGLEGVFDTTSLATNVYGQTIEVTCYPGANNQEFLVQAYFLHISLGVHLFGEMWFIMPFEIPDTVPICWFMEP
ncbi:hypothetical protein L1987_09596 [Smallanthus sonchifolius]|uniref:Uncharacterized protein n=1 Tax=Smallanthus sonchifolius TaxID=185202 RepID=A0ACB9JNU2_9ASTR|nr:hypothetical protein L1987_09596 [Smallanthus sonchifolius]